MQWCHHVMQWVHLIMWHFYIDYHAIKSYAHTSMHRLRIVYRDIFCFFFKEFFRPKSYYVFYLYSLQWTNTNIAINVMFVLPLYASCSAIYSDDSVYIGNTFDWQHCLHMEAYHLFQYLQMESAKWTLFYGWHSFKGTSDCYPHRFMWFCLGK